MIYPTTLADGKILPRKQRYLMLAALIESSEQSTELPVAHWEQLCQWVLDARSACMAARMAMDGDLLVRWSEKDNAPIFWYPDEED